MIVPSPRTWTVGEQLTAAKLNTELRDAINFLLSPPTALLHGSGTQSLSNNTWTAINWANEQYDNDGGHSNSSSPSRFTAQTAGWYELTATGSWASGAGVLRGLKFRKSNSADYGELIGGLTSNGLAALHISASVQLAVGDYVEVFAYQDSGGSLNFTYLVDTSPNFFHIRWKNP